MDLDTFIVAVSCTIDEELDELAKSGWWRVRGPKLRVTDSEVLTREVVGESLGIDTDRGLYAAFFNALLALNRQLAPLEAPGYPRIAQYAL